MHSEPKADEPTTAATSGGETAATVASASAAGATAHATSYVDPSIALEARVIAQDTQIKDLTDRLLRTAAEMDNIRKRTEREKADTVKYAITKFANDIVGMGDNFQRAIAAVPAGAAESDPALKSLLDGVGLIEREFLSVLERHGVTRVDAKGEAFNPNFHQAVMEREDRDVPAGTVLQVFQPGYMIEDRVLRSAMVVVSTGGFKPMKPVAVKQEAEAAASEISPTESGDASSPPEPKEG